MTANRLLAASATVMAIVAAACGGSTLDRERPVGTPPLVGSWQLVEATAAEGPVALVDSHPVTLTFDDDGTLGGAACNSYGGRFILRGERITIRDLSATEMACLPEEVMALEQAYLAALPLVDTATVDEDRLVLAGDRVELVLTRLAGPEDHA